MMLCAFVFLLFTDCALYPEDARVINAPPREDCYLQGDANQDYILDISDAVYILKFLFAQGEVLPCREAADMDASGEVNVGDVVLILRSQFLLPFAEQIICREEAG